MVINNKINVLFSPESLYIHWVTATSIWTTRRLSRSSWQGHQSPFQHSKSRGLWPTLRTSLLTISCWKTISHTLKLRWKWPFRRFFFLFAFNTFDFHTFSENLKFMTYKVGSKKKRPNFLCSVFISTLFRMKLVA